MAPTARLVANDPVRTLRFLPASPITPSVPVWELPLSSEQSFARVRYQLQATWLTARRDNLNFRVPTLYSLYAVIAAIFHYHSRAA